MRHQEFYEDHFKKLHEEQIKKSNQLNHKLHLLELKEGTPHQYTREELLRETPLGVKYHCISTPETRGELTDPQEYIEELVQRWTLAHQHTSILTVFDLEQEEGYFGDLSLEIGSRMFYMGHEEFFKETELPYVERLRYYSTLILVLNQDEVPDVHEELETYLKLKLPRMEDLENLLVIID